MTAAINFCRRLPGLAPLVARQGTAFYDEHLGPEAIEAHTLELLRLYAALCPPPAGGSV